MSLSRPSLKKISRTMRAIDCFCHTLKESVLKIPSYRLKKLCVLSKFDGVPVLYHLTVRFLRHLNVYTFFSRRMCVYPLHGVSAKSPVPGSHRRTICFCDACLNLSTPEESRRPFSQEYSRSNPIIKTRAANRPPTNLNIIQICEPHVQSNCFPRAGRHSVCSMRSVVYPLYLSRPSVCTIHVLLSLLPR